LLQAQGRLLAVLGTLAVALTLGLWSVHWLDLHSGMLLLITAAAAVASLHREFFRMALFAAQQPQDVLPLDILYALLLIAGVGAATFTEGAATGAMVSLGLAAAVCAWRLAGTLRGRVQWRQRAAPEVLRDMAPSAAWSTAGAAIHWTFSQGYIYLVAGILDVNAVAAIAATRLLLMPVNLLSSGIGSLMLPVASAWLVRLGANVVLRRLAALALGLVLLTLCYLAALWAGREWVFGVVLKKQFAERDTLLLLWGMIFLVILVRDQLGYLLAAEGRFRGLMVVTLVCALVALGASYVAMQRFGVVGALVGMLIGECVSLIGVGSLALRRVAPAERLPPLLPPLSLPVPVPSATKQGRWATALLLWHAVRYARPGAAPVGWRRTVSHFARCVAHLGSFRDWYGNASRPELQRTLALRPSLVNCVVHPYLDIEWGAERKLAVVAEHYRLLTGPLAFLSFPPNEERLLAELAVPEQGVFVGLDKPGGYEHEGEVCFHLSSAGLRLYTISFTLGEPGGVLTAYVGGLQGVGGRVDALALYRDLTHRLHGLRPRDLLVVAFRLFCEAIGVQRILAISDRARVSTSPYFENSVRVHASYDEIWLENGAEPAAEGFFLLVPGFTPRGSDDIPARKRALYRRRYALLDTLGEQLRRAVSQGNVEP
jgi:uncharacterized protein VirK/YbjX